MNDLEKALQDLSDGELDCYLEVTPTHAVRKDIEQIRRNAALTTEAGRLRERLLAVLAEDV